MEKEYYYIINKETKKAYAKREHFADAVEVANRKINGYIVSQKDWDNMKKD